MFLSFFIKKPQILAGKRGFSKHNPEGSAPNSNLKGIASLQDCQAELNLGGTMRPYIISVSNQKGGVGKTTTSFQVSIYLAGTGRKTLLIDTDPQGNLTKSLIDSDNPGMYEALTGSDYDIPEIMPNLFLLAGSIRLATLEKSLIGEMDAYIRLKELLSLEMFSEFEYILIDTPPSLGVLTINALPHRATSSRR